jgi:spermidine/putrescine transport system ATP-binding protein
MQQSLLRTPALPADLAAEHAQADAPGSVPDIRFIDVTKRFGEVLAVDRVSLAIAPGGFHSFLGPSGCGKTTSLRLIAGFDQPTSGSVEIAGRPMNGVPAYRRPVNMVFQHYALFPHLDVAGNIAYGLRQRSPRPPREQIARQVAATLELVRLPGLGHRRVWELSGGQQQRVALARALINRPTVLLLDEPLAALDRKLRREMQIELQNLQREVGITFVLVTHDQEEALSMSDTIAIMRDGRIVQSGTPRQLYDAPVNRYVADFVGETNFFAGEVVTSDSDGAQIRTATGQVFAARSPVAAMAPTRGTTGVVAVRPEVVQIWGGARDVPGGLDVALSGRVRNRIYLGDHTEFSVALGALGDVLVRVPKATDGTADLAPGQEVMLGWRADQALALAQD